MRGRRSSDPSRRCRCENITGRELNMKPIARYVTGVMVLLCAVVAGNARAQVCNAPLPEVSAAIIPANGFPLYYVDASGLALQPCLNLAGCGALAATLPNPLAPISFQANFPPESFYARAVAKFTAGTVSGLYTAALEGTFFNGVVAAGNQMVFTRVRVNLAGLQPNAVYTVSHPYGVKTLTADALGVINDTVTVGAIPISLLPTAFSLALNGPVGSTFLTWDTAPPAGFIGDGLTPHTITGSPCGTNFVQVTGPGLPIGGVGTNLFTITGQTINVCGNGVLDVGEQCDDGNTLAGDCCSPTCKFEPLGSPCTAASVCTNNACNGAGACGFLSFNAIPCTDGNVCTVGDTCTLGACLGTPANCDDANVCTTDLCTPPVVGCVHLANALVCDDGKAATTARAADPAQLPHPGYGGGRQQRTDPTQLHGRRGRALDALVRRPGRRTSASARPLRSHDVRGAGKELRHDPRRLRGHANLRRLHRTADLWRRWRRERLRRRGPCSRDRGTHPDRQRPRWRDRLVDPRGPERPRRVHRLRHLPRRDQRQPRRDQRPVRDLVGSMQQRRNQAPYLHLHAER